MTTNNFGSLVEVAGLSLLAVLAAACGCWALGRLLHCLGVRNVCQALGTGAALKSSKAVDAPLQNADAIVNEQVLFFVLELL